MTAHVVVLDVTLLEAAHLSGIIRQFVDLLDATEVDDESDPAVARLVPDAYRDDPEASAEFRRLTGADLLARRRGDAQVVLAGLSDDGTELDPSSLDDDSATTPMTITLDREEAAAWMRSLTALRLVLASRLGIENDTDYDSDDPRFGVYEWLGYRLEGLIDAVDRAS